MSASQDKKKRQADREAGIDRRTMAERQADEKRRKERTKWTIGTVIVVILVAAILMANSPVVSRGLNSVTIGGEKYNNVEYQYYYNAAYSNYYMFIDGNKAASAQQCMLDPTMTWAEFFRQNALDTMTQTTALYEAAIAEGYALTEEDSATIDESFASMKEDAAANNLSMKSYLVRRFGRGCTEKQLRGILEKELIVSRFAQDYVDSLEYTPEQLNAWYAENKDAQDLFDYTYYLVAAETEEVTETVTDPETQETTEQTVQKVTDKTMAAAKATADQLAEAATDAEAFAAAVEALGEDAAVKETAGGQSNGFDAAYSEWMLDAARQPGDVTVAESEGEGYYVVLFQNRDDNSYRTQNSRHILIRAVDEDGDGVISDSEKEAAKAAVEAIYEEWKAGEATEDSFAALANEKSEDGGSNTTGGLYENVQKGSFVPEYNDFIYAEGRKPGDTAIVYGESGNYTGYHLVYYVGEGERYCDVLAKNTLSNEDYQAWITSLTEGYSASTNFVIRFADER